MHPDVHQAAFESEARHAEWLEHFGLPCARCGAMHEPDAELDGLPLCSDCQLAACCVFFGEALRAVEAEMAESGAFGRVV